MPKILNTWSTRPKTLFLFMIFFTSSPVCNYRCQVKNEGHKLRNTCLCDQDDLPRRKANHQTTTVRSSSLPVYNREVEKCKIRDRTFVKPGASKEGHGKAVKSPRVADSTARPV